jgi:hypothetical protein
VPYGVGGGFRNYLSLSLSLQARTHTVTYLIRPPRICVFFPADAPPSPLFSADANVRQLTKSLESCNANHTKQATS